MQRLSLNSMHGFTLVTVAAIVLMSALAVGVHWFAERLPPSIGYPLLLLLSIVGMALSLGLTRQQLRRRIQADALLHGFITHPPLVMTLRDPQGRYLMANARYCQLVGKEESEIIGRRPADIFGPEHGARMEREMAATIASGQATAFENRTPTTEGVLDFLTFRFPVYGADKKELLAVGAVAIDISERKCAERQLVDREAEFDRLARDNARQREAAEAANRTKSEFLAHMSHELRTPLNAIIGFAEIIEKRLLGVDPDTYSRYAADILHSGQHLLGVINDVLDLSRVESGRYKLSLEPHDLDMLLVDCCRLVDGRARDGQVDLIRKIPNGLAPVLIDARATQQALLNLLSNAVKFTPAGGTVTVDAIVDDDGGMAVRVRDTGPGIPAEQQGHLFEPFWQDPTLARRSHGTGLGLVISRKLMRLQGGDVTIDSELGRGTLAMLRLPQTPARAS